MIKGFTHADLGPIWYHSEHSDVPYSPSQFLGWDFFAVSYSKTALVGGFLTGLKLDMGFLRAFSATRLSSRRPLSIVIFLTNSFVINFQSHLVSRED